MVLVLLGQHRDSNYDSLLEFCSSRGIKLVEEKVTSTNKQSTPCDHEYHTYEVHECTICGHSYSD